MNGPVSSGKWSLLRPRHFLQLAGSIALLLAFSACGGRVPSLAPPSPATPASSTLPGTPGRVEAGPLPTVLLDQGDRGRGERLFSGVGCIGCHTIKGVGGNVGPELTEVAKRAPSRAAAQGLERPELYFVQSIVYPKAYVVQGFTPVMPNWKELGLTEKDLADLAAYLKTLTGE